MPRQVLPDPTKGGGVSGTTTQDIAGLLDRLRRGDDTARRAILERAYHRLVRIAAAIFHEDFRGLRDRHDVESVVSELWIRLVGALEKTQPQTLDGFFGLVFVNVRHALLDLARRQRRDDARRHEGPLDAEGSQVLAAFDRADTTNDPARLALLTELHSQVETLPDDERTVFDLRYYGGYSQAEIAQILGLHPRKVSRLWYAATTRLSGWLGEYGRLF
jgi:RNA polymerase sigma factor (sigma-70 family)